MSDKEKPKGRPPTSEKPPAEKPKPPAEKPPVREHTTFTVDGRHEPPKKK